MFRLIFLTFFGKERYDEHHVHVHESPKSMLVPLAILAVLSDCWRMAGGAGVLGQAGLFREISGTGIRGAQRERSRNSGGRGARAGNSAWRSWR